MINACQQTDDIIIFLVRHIILRDALSRGFYYKEILRFLFSRSKKVIFTQKKIIFKYKYKNQFSKDCHFRFGGHFFGFNRHFQV